MYILIFGKKYEVYILEQGPQSLIINPLYDTCYEFVEKTLIILTFES